MALGHGGSVSDKISYPTRALRLIEQIPESFLARGASRGVHCFECEGKHPPICEEWNEMRR